MAASSRLAGVISTLGRLPLVAGALRWAADRYAEGPVERIRSGLAAGFLWERHHRYVNGYWIGQYELPVQEALRRELKPGQAFFDVGANAGFFVAARIVGPAGRCVAFDPSPENYGSIAAQIRLNGLTQCEAIMAAVGEEEAVASFSFDHPCSFLGHLGMARAGQQQIEVKVITPDQACARSGPPHLVKLDIEGAEIQALRGAQHALRQARPWWLIELHGPECEARVKRILLDAGYAFFELSGAPLTVGAALPRHVLARPGG
jgi:FkbM family methyltransferase